MKKPKTWSYAPYKPLFFNTGDIYICRIAPVENAITIDWLPVDGVENYNVYIREKDVGEFVKVGVTSETTFTVTGRKNETDYAFYIEAAGKKSRVRLARCGETLPGATIINYLHPEDEAYIFSGHCLCSPSIIRHPDGYLLASMDVFKDKYPQNLTLIYRSDDDGKTWKYVSELFPCFWGKMFVHNGDVYMLACSTEYGDLLIGKSSDGGKNFTEPTVLFRGGNGKNGEPGCHKNPEPVVIHNGRIWNTVEWGSWGRCHHAPMVVSAPVDADLLDSDSWEFSVPVKYNPEWKGLPKGMSAGNIEGCLTPIGDNLYTVMRYDMSKLERTSGLVMRYKVNTKDPGALLEFDRTIEFPANASKFEMIYDEDTKKWYSIASRIKENENGTKTVRNLLTLFVSDDCINWEIARDLIDMSDRDPGKIGFQYVDMFIENGTIYYLVRTAINNAANFHDANYSLFFKLPISDI